jgi:hypothetical protein
MESRCVGGRSSVNAEENPARTRRFFFAVIVPIITEMSFEDQPSAGLVTWLVRPDQYALESPLRAFRFEARRFP